MCAIYKIKTMGTKMRPGWGGMTVFFHGKIALFSFQNGLLNMNVLYLCKKKSHWTKLTCGKLYRQVQKEAENVGPLGLSAMDSAVEKSQDIQEARFPALPWQILGDLGLPGEGRV